MLRRILTVLLLVSATAGCIVSYPEPVYYRDRPSPTPSAYAEASKLYRRGMREFNLGSPKAIPLLRQAIQKIEAVDDEEGTDAGKREYADAYYCLGKALDDIWEVGGGRQKTNKEAVRCFQHAVRWSPRWDSHLRRDANVKIAYICSWVRRYDDALQAVAELEREFPNDPQTLGCGRSVNDAVGWDRLGHGDLAGATLAFKRAYTIDPNEDEGYFPAAGMVAVCDAIRKKSRNRAGVQAACMTGRIWLNRAKVAYQKNHPDGPLVYDNKWFKVMEVAFAS